MNIFPNLRSCSWYFYALLMLITTGGLLLMINGKAGSFILLNSYHSPMLDIFFTNYTFIGDGLFAVCFLVLAILVFKNRQQALALLIAFLISGLAAQLMKNIFNSPRPKLFFEAGRYAHFIDGVSLANNASLPSGHTATAFALATVLALMIKNKSRQLLILIIAALVGYSRIYLAQHFLLDVIVGAIVGSVSGILSLYLSVNIDYTRHFLYKRRLLKLTMR